LKLLPYPPKKEKGKGKKRKGNQSVIRKKHSRGLKPVALYLSMSR
jgi:hypothetical protein